MNKKTQTQAGIDSLPGYLQDAQQSGYLNLSPSETSPIFYIKSKGNSLSNTDNAIAGNSVLRDMVNNIYFGNSSHSSYTNQIFAEVDEAAEKIALRHYVSITGNANIGMSMFGIDRLSSMISTGRGNVISTDTETFGIKGTLDMPGITELGYFTRSAKTMGEISDMKSMFDGLHDGANARRSFLFGIGDDEYNSVMKIINKAKRGDVLTREESVTLDRSAKYADANISWDKSKNRFMLGQIGEGVSELDPKERLLEKAFKGINVLSGRQTGFEAMREQTIFKDKAHQFVFDWLRESSDIDNLHIIYNHQFDTGVMDNIIRIMKPHMSDQMSAQFDSLKLNSVSKKNLFDPMEYLNLAFENNSSELYSQWLKTNPSSNDKGHLTLENVMESIYGKVYGGTDNMPKIHHQADIDAKNALNILNYKDDSGNLIFGGIKNRIKNNLAYSVNPEERINNIASEIKQGDLMYFTNGVQRGMLDSITYDHGGTMMIDKSNNARNIIGSKEVLKFDGIKKGNVSSLLHGNSGLSNEQQAALLNAINSGAMKNDFMVAVFKNAYNQNIMMYGQDEYEISRKLQPGITIGHSFAQGSFLNGAANIRPEAQRVLGGTQADLDLRVRGLTGDMDKAQRRYRAWFDIGDSSRSARQAKQFYSVAAELKRKGINKEEFFNLAFNGREVKGMNYNWLAQNLMQYTYNGETLHSTSRARDMYQMYDRLLIESDTFMPAINKIEESIGNLDVLSGSDTRLVKAKAMLSQIHSSYVSTLEGQGIGNTRTINKLGYEKNAVAIPRNLFNYGDVDASIASLRSGKAFDEIATELNLANVHSSAGSVLGMIRRAGKDIGADYSHTFETSAANRLADYLVKRGYLGEGTAKSIQDMSSSSAFVKIKDILNSVRKSGKGIPTSNDKIDLLDFTHERASRVASAITDNNGSINNVMTSKVDEIITGVKGSFGVASSHDFEKSMRAELMKSDFIQDIIKNGSKNGVKSELYDAEAVAKSTAEALSKSMASIAGRVKDKGKDFHVAIHKVKGTHNNSYQLVFGESRNVLGEGALHRGANVGIVELGSIVNYQGLPVITKGGYKQVMGMHIDTYKAMEKGFNARNMELYDSYSYSMKRIGINAESIADAFVNGDMRRAESRINSKMNEVVGKLKRLDSNIYQEGDAIKKSDFLYSMKIYTDEGFKALGHESMNGISELISQGATIGDLNSFVSKAIANNGGRKTLVSKVKDRVNELNKNNLVDALKIMFKDASGNSISPIAAQIAKYSKITGIPDEQIMNLMFAVHEGDANKGLSAWGIHPTALHPTGYMQDSRRPGGRQTLGGRTFFKEDFESAIAGSGNTDIQFGFPIETKATNIFRNTIERHTGRIADNTVTGNVLFMSQENLSKSLQRIIDTELSNPNITEEERRKLTNLHRLSVNNGESIIANEVAKIIADREIKEYYVNPTFQLHESVAKAFANSGDINSARVTKGEVIGYEKTSGGIKKVIASGDGTLQQAGDGRLLLTHDKMANDTVKVGINGMEKSAGMALTDYETGLLRKHLGNFSVIMNNELGKHSAFNAIYNDMFSKRYLEIHNSSTNKEADFKQLEKDMGDALGGGSAAKLVRDNKGNVSGIRVLAHDLETSSKAEDVSNRRLNAIMSIHDRYSKNRGNDGYYDIVRTLKDGTKVNVYKSTISGMSMTDDIIKDKGIKIDTRVMESLLRSRDENGQSIMKAFVKDLYKFDGKSFVGPLVKRTELKRLDRTHADANVIGEFLKRYSANGSNAKFDKVRSIDSILDADFYRKSFNYKTKVDWQDMTDYMINHGKMFGKDHDFVKVNLGQNVRLKSNGETVDHMYLPNVSMAHAGDNPYLSTNYQKKMASFVNASIDLRDLSHPSKLKDKTTDEVISNFHDSVNDLYDAIKLDYSAKKGTIGSMFDVRLKNSGTALNKELYQAVGKFTAGRKGNEDIVYLSEGYAQRLLGDKYDDYKKYLTRDGALERIGKSGKHIEDAWGMHGLALRYPTIMDQSARVVKFRVAEGKDGERLLGGRQIAQFRHTSYGSNADVDGDQIAVALIDHDSISKEAKQSLVDKYAHQKAQNNVAKILTEEEYKKTNGLLKDANSALSIKEVLAGLKNNESNPFTSRLDKDGIDAIYGAFESKVGVGKANIPSFYLRQHAIQAFNQGDIDANQLKLVGAFSETAEQKMIDSIKKDNIQGSDRPIDMYFDALRNNNPDKLQQLAYRMKDDLSSDVLKRYAYQTGDGDLATAILNKNKTEIEKHYAKLTDALHTTLSKSSYKRAGMELALDGKLSEETMYQAMTKGMVQIRDTAQDLSWQRIGMSSTYNDAKKSTDMLTEHLQKHSNHGIIGESAETATEYFKQAMNNAGDKGIQMAARAKEFFSSTSAKKAGIFLAGAAVASMAIGAMTKRPAQRNNDDVGMADEGNMPITQPSGGSTPIYPAQQGMNGQGIQININASNKNGLKHSDIQSMLRQSFGGNMNIKMNVNDNSKDISPNFINDVMMNSLGF